MSRVAVRTMKQVSRWWWVPLWLGLMMAAQPGAEAGLGGPSSLMNKGVGAQPRSGAMLWKIERSGLRPSYVFATIQSEDPRVADIPMEVVQAFRVTDTFAMEMIPDEAALARMSGSMFIKQGPNLKELLGAESFARTAQVMTEFDIPADILAKLNPWVVFTALTMPKTDEGVFLDVILYGAALHEGKPIHGLETADEQVSSFEGIPVADQVTILKAVVDNYDGVARHNERMINSYTRGDYSAIAAMGNNYLGLSNGHASQVLRKHTVDDRNLRMVERMLPRIEEESAFIAVNAVHLPGERGLLHLLEQRGYQVSPVH